MPRIPPGGSPRKSPHGWFGITPTHDGRWRGQLGTGGPEWRTLNLGVYDTRVEAARAVWRAAKVHRPDLDLPWPEGGGGDA